MKLVQGFQVRAQNAILSAESEVYRLLDDIWFHASASRDGALLSWETASREGAELFGYDSPVGRRFAQSVEYFEFLRKEIAGVFARWQEYKNSQAGAGRSPGEG